LRTCGGLLDPLHPLIARHDPTWRRFAVTLGLMVCREQHSSSDWRKARASYVAERLRNPEMRFGQITYFKEKQAKAGHYFHKTALLGRRFTMAAALFVFGALVYKTWMWLGYSQNLHTAAESSAHGWGWRQALIDIAFRLMPIALPLAAG